MKVIMQYPQYTCESQYSLKIFRENNIPYSWETIYVGWKLNRLTSKEIENYAVEYLFNNPSETNEYIAEIACSVKFDHEVNNLLEKIFEHLKIKSIKKGSEQWELERIKWRYCILMEMVKYIQGYDILLSYVEGVYADFGYPEDMEEFIYYMPSKEPIKSLTCEEALQQLIDKLNKFLVQEKVNIENKVINPLSQVKIESE